MSGLLYKNFYVNRGSLIFILCIQAAVSAGVICMCLFGGKNLIREENAGGAALVLALLYYLGYLLPSILSGEPFRNDESRSVCSFVTSSPIGAKGHVASKYYYILIVYVGILFCDFITDTIVLGITGGAVSVSIVLIMLFCWRLLLAAVEMPFMVRFGSERGVQIKGAVTGGIIALFWIYFLFGDISFLVDCDDPLRSLNEWLSTDNVTLSLSVFPYISAAAYYLSYRISVRLYRKGAENYEQ